MIKKIITLISITSLCICFNNEARSLLYAKKGNVKNTTHFTLSVSGIECPDCAQSVVDIVKECNGQTIHFEQKNKDYTNCYTSFTWPTDSNPPFHTLAQKIAKEGFEDFTLQGTFCGEIKPEGDTLFLVFDATKENIVLKNYAGAIKKGRIIKITGTLTHNIKTGCYQLTS